MKSTVFSNYLRPSPPGPPQENKYKTVFIPFPGYAPPVRTKPPILRPGVPA